MGRLAAGGRSLLRALLPAELNICRCSAPCEGSASRLRCTRSAPASGMLWLMRRRKLDWGAALFARGVAGVRLVHGRAHPPHHLRADDGVAAAHARRRRGLPRRAARALAGARGGGDGDGARLRRAAAGAVRGDRRSAPTSCRGCGPSTARRARASGSWLVGGGVVGGLLAAAQIVPTVAHLPYSPRSLGVDYAFASSYAWPDARYLGDADRARRCSAAPSAGSGTARSTTGRWPAGTRAR